jgi:hypothetical protein
VFSAAAGDVPLPGAPAITSDPYQSIQSLVGFLNATPAYTTPGPDLLNGLPGQSGYETGDSSISPLNGAGNRNYGFAIARVRIQGTTANPANNVRVFFRLFVAQSCDTDFQPSTTYLSQLGSGAEAGLPVFPEASATGLSDPSGNSLQTVPFFATDAAGTHDYDGSVANANIRQVVVPAGRDKAWSYFGCYLDVYNPSNQSRFPGTHHCIVAQIAYDQTPVANAGGVTLSPESSDKLAQRNLQITASGNPGFPDTHVVPQVFDSRPSPTPLGSGQLLEYPDELMVDWGNVPAGSRASIYWPGAQAADVIALASTLYGHNSLVAADASTIICQTTAGVTYIPIPRGMDNLAGLFTIELPAGVVAGQEFKLRVRRLTSRRVERSRAGDPVKINAAVEELAKVHDQKVPTLNWRYVTGTFQVTVPVVDDAQLLATDQNTLAIMRWRLEHFSAGSRWRPVLQRLVTYLARRVDGAGGQAEKVEPSLWGFRATEPKIPNGAESVREVTGKISSLVFDKFGDFEGFWLETWHEDVHFLAREPEIEQLARQAWSERILISVYTDTETSERPHKILFRREPVRLGAHRH